jgi:transcriptional regulator with XRE-family HTH domain
MGAPYPNLGEMQPKNLCRTTNRKIGRFAGMKETNPTEFGRRVRERRKELGLSQEKLADFSGYSQTNIGWIEKGSAKRPQSQALALAEALKTTADWLLWEIGPKDVGPPILTEDEAKETYHLLSLEDRAAISEAMLKCLEATRQNRKSG